MSRRLFLTVACASALAVNGEAADHYDDNYQQDYSQDGLYADYARQQQVKEVAAKAPFGWGKIFLGAGVGWVMGGKIHAQRKEKKLNALHKKEQKALYTQYYNDVYQLQQQNAEMSDALAKLGYRVK